MPDDNSNTLVLVADDEPSTLALVASHVRSKGFKVIEASDGDEAWMLAHEHLPDLVVLDVMMPGMSGWEVCRKIREAVSLAHTGIVMLTGIGENLNEMTSPLYGADSYLDKPFEFSDLDEKIQETLEKRGQGTMGREDDADVVTSAAAAPPSSEPEPLPETRRMPKRSEETKPAKKKAGKKKPAKKKRPAKKKKAAKKKAGKKKPAKKKRPAKKKKAAKGKGDKKRPAKKKKVAKKKRPAKKKAGKKKLAKKRGASRRSKKRR